MKTYVRCFAVTVFLLMTCVTTAQASLPCYGCHGTSIPVDYRPLDASFRNPSSGGFPGNHRTHMDSAALPAACETCHSGSNSYSSSHRDGQIKISSRINGSPLTTLYKNTTSSWPQTAITTPGNCANVNCHFETATPSWGNSPALTGCATCHGAPPAGTAASYSGGAAGSHAKHDQYYPGNGNCKKCHPDNATFAHAIDASKRDLLISFAAPPNNGSGSYTGSLNDYLPSQGNAYGVCNATYCHSNATGGVPNVAPTWGTPLPADCSGCHGGAAGSAAILASGKHPAHVNNAVILGTHYSCGECHARSAAGNTTISTLANHVNGFVDFSGNKAGRGGTYNTSTGVCSATYCHTDGKGTAKSMITDNWKNSAVLGCNGCHGSDPAPAFSSGAAGEPNYTNGGAGAARANSHQRHTTSGPSTCDACHTGTTISGAAIKSGSVLHTNRTPDVTFNPAKAGAGATWTAADKSCSNIACHGNGSAPAQWGSTSCLGCHAVTQGSRAAITAQFGAGSHHIQGAVSDDKCYQCHWEANSDGSINPSFHNASVSGAAVRLVIYSTMQRPRNAARYFVAYTANGKRTEIQKINSHCLGCHNSTNDNAQPFGDGKKPKQYAWDDTSVAARYSQNGKTSWGKYTSAAYPNAARKKIDKSLSAHGNAGGNNRFWDTASGVDGNMLSQNTSGTVNVQCYDCHNSHGSTIAGITSRYSSATGRNRGAILKDTVAGKGGYAVSYKPYSGGSIEGKNKRNPGASLCLDCHMTPDALTTPWGYASTYGATQGILGYWDSPMYKGYTSAGAEQRFTYKKRSDVSGGHFGASMTMSSTPTATIGGLCTPCHDPHGVSPTLGSKQQYAVPLLKGTWLTSPYVEDVAPSANVSGTYRKDFGFEGVPYHIDQNTFGSNIAGGAVPGLAFNDISVSAGLCLGCHPKTGLTDGVTHTWTDKNRVHESVNGWKSSGGSIKHSYSCSKCHSAHTNSVLPRLMVTNCLDGRHKGRFANNPGAVITGDGSGDDMGCYGMAARSPACSEPNYLFAAGSGNIPGRYSGGDGSYNPLSCHEGNTGIATDQSWNVVTPWAAGSPTLISPTATAIGSSTATLGANLTSDGGVAITSRGTVWGSSPNPAGNVAAEGGTATGVFSHVRSGLTAGTKIYYRGYATNISGTTYSLGGSFYTEPTLQASGVNFTSVSATGMTVNWSRGNGDGVIVLIRQGSAVNSDPADGSYTTYTASTAFGSGTQTGPGNFVVYRGTGSSVAVTGLTAGTTYYVAVYEYKGTVNSSGVNQGTNYKQTPATGSRATSPSIPLLSSPTATAIGSSTATLGANLTSTGGATITARGTVWGTIANPTGNAVAEGGSATGIFSHARSGLTSGTKIYYRGYATNSAGTGYSADGSFYTEPSSQASGVNFTSVGSTGMTVNWARGNGDGVIVLMKQGAAVNSDPADGSYTTYTASTAFGSGTQTGPGNFVVYRGTGSSVAVTGLTAGTTYYVAVYEYKGTVNSSGVNQGTNYKPSPATGSQATPPGGTTHTETFDFIGAATQSLAIPAGATNIQFTVKGAGGGGGQADDVGNQSSGLPGHLVATSHPTSGITLTIYVGQGGQINSEVNGGAGGWGYTSGQFGSNGEEGDGYAFGSSGGGGSSAIKLGATLLAEAAGGNGGRSSDWDIYSAGEGGTGGGSDYPATTLADGGGAGGAAGSPPYDPGIPGSPGQVVITYDY
ncbi:MAG TPA: hypothetical protein DER40_11025 [Geobacter sp.]|nr:hypothetical protein [Geobacter sp.]